jgi:hypothetical protein
MSIGLSIILLSLLEAPVSCSKSVVKLPSNAVQRARIALRAIWTTLPFTARAKAGNS